MKNKHKHPEQELNTTQKIDMDKISVHVKLITPYDKIQIIKEYMDYCFDINIEPHTIFALNEFEKHLYEEQE